MSAYDLSELYAIFGKDEKRLCQTIDTLAEQHGEEVYQQLLSDLFNRPFSSAAASRYWRETMNLHPPAVSRLNHRAALLNYLFFHTDELNDPRVIEANDLQSLYKSAISDGLTQLYNQSHFKQRLEEMIAYCNQHPGSLFSLLLFDLDHFKQFNDRCGHLRGDRVLQELARLLQAQLPESALAARYGGEEFAVLLPGTGLAQAISLAERIRNGVEQTPFAGEERLDRGKLTISGGVASYPAAGKTSVALLGHADSKLYEAKVVRNCIYPKPSESRGILRHAFRSIVELRSTKEGPFKQALSADISYTGMLLKTAASPEVGKQLELRFPSPFWPSAHRTSGNVRHVRDNGQPNHYLVGIEFVKPEVDFIERILPEELYLSSTP